MSLPSDDVILLYAPKHPITDLTIREIGAFVDIGVEILNRYAGALRIRLEDAPTVILQLLANTSREVGFISGGGVVWHIEPEMFGTVSVIDSYGTIHSVTNLERA